jgi:flagella basal body P-ring formation protein FlgA
MMKTVKTSTLENSTKQMLCRLFLRGLRDRRWLGLLLGLGLITHSLAPLAAPEVAAPKAVLQKSVVEWVAKEQSLSPDAVVLAPMDPRMQVRACEKPLLMDLPFASLEKLRVRCTQPTWQIFVRVSVLLRPTVKTALAVPSAVPLAEPKPKPVAEMRKVLVANAPLYKGQVLNESHVRVVDVDSKGLTGQILESVTQVMYAEVVRDVKADVPLRSQDIRPMLLVKRGQMVLMSVGQAQGFQISARVEAMQDGRLNDQIKLKNKESGRILTGQVKGPNLVEGL